MGIPSVVCFYPTLLYFAKIYFKLVSAFSVCLNNRKHFNCSLEALILAIQAIALAGACDNFHVK